MSRDIKNACPGPCVKKKNELVQGPLKWVCHRSLCPVKKSNEFVQGPVKTKEGATLLQRKRMGLSRAQLGGTYHSSFPGNEELFSRSLVVLSMSNVGSNNDIASQFDEKLPLSEVDWDTI